MPLSSLRHPLPPSSSPPPSRLTREQAYVVRRSLSHAPVVSPTAILSRDHESRLPIVEDSFKETLHISDLVGSSSDLRISPVTFGPSTFGFGHRIYFRSSLDLSDSPLILEIGHSSEILRISRPFTHPVPFPSPLSFELPSDSTLMWPSSLGRPSAPPSPIP